MREGKNGIVCLPIPISERVGWRTLQETDYSAAKPPCQPRNITGFIARGKIIAGGKQLSLLAEFCSPKGHAVCAETGT